MTLLDEPTTEELEWTEKLREVALAKIKELPPKLVQRKLGLLAAGVERLPHKTWTLELATRVCARLGVPTLQLVASHEAKAPPTVGELAAAWRERARDLLEENEYEDDRAVVFLDCAEQLEKAIENCQAKLVSYGMDLEGLRHLRYDSILSPPAASVLLEALDLPKVPE